MSTSTGLSGRKLRDKSAVRSIGTTPEQNGAHYSGEARRDVEDRSQSVPLTGVASLPQIPNTEIYGSHEDPQPKKGQGALAAFQERRESPLR